MVEATTVATSSTTGSIVAKGGMGIAENIYAGSAIVAEGTTVSSSSVTGSLLTKGGLGVAGKAYFGDMLMVESTTAAVNHVSGAIVTAGGMGVAKSVYSGGQVVASIEDTVNSGVTDVLVLKHSTTGTAANGIGVGISVGIEDAGGLAEAAALDFTLIDVTSLNEDANMDIKLMTAGSMGSALTVTGSLLTMSGGLKMLSGSVTQATNLEVSLPSISIYPFLFPLGPLCLVRLLP